MISIEVLNMKPIERKISQLFFFIFSLLIFLMIPIDSLAHEQWFLTHEQMKHLISEENPPLFTEINLTNTSIILLALFVSFILVKLNKGPAREFFPYHQNYLSSISHLVPLILRVGTAVMIFMAVFGLNPRHGVDFFDSPTDIFPDLQLDSLSSHWYWLKWLELGIGVGLLLGIYVRLMATLFLIFGVISLFLFKIGMLCYFGFLLAITSYLILQGGGAYYLNLPTPKMLLPFKNLVEKQPQERAQFLLRIFTGLDFAMTGFVCKFLYPNLAISLLNRQHMYTYGLQMETVVFWMATIETFAGLLIMFGVLVRPISFILLGCFIYMAFAIHEPLYSHMIFYGVLLACYINGRGYWNPSSKETKSSNIVIWGASLAGIYAARKLEHLISRFPLANLIIVHSDNYFQFGPLLSEVISGQIQPNHIINSIRELCPRAKFIQGSVKIVDAANQQLEIAVSDEQDILLNYDQLIIAHEKIELSDLSKMNEYAIPINTISDALFIKKQVLDCLEKAELIANKKDREYLLTFAIVGAELRGTSVATEIYSLIYSALPCYPSLSFDEIKIILFSEKKELLSTFDYKISRAVEKTLTRMGVIIRKETEIASIAGKKITLATNENIICNTMIMSALKVKNHLEVNKDFKLKESQNIFSVGISAYIANNIPFQAHYETQLGEFVALNAWRNFRGKNLKKWNNKNYFFGVAFLGKAASIVKLGPINFHGLPAWFISRLICIMTIPGLEKNLRLILDGLFNLPFRPNISSFSIRLSNHPPKYEPILVLNKERD